MTRKHIIRGGRAVSLDDSMSPLGERMEFGTLYFKIAQNAFQARIVGLDVGPDLPYEATPGEAVKALEIYMARSNGEEIKPVPVLELINWVKKEYNG